MGPAMFDTFLLFIRLYMSNLDGSRLASQITIATGGTVGVAELMDVVSTNIGLIGVSVAILSMTTQFYFSVVNLKIKLKRLDLELKEDSLSRREQALANKIKELSENESPKF